MSKHSKKDNSKRWRCLVAGCNPQLEEASAQAHSESTGHRVAKWPVRSQEGQKLERQRNKTGYYDKYNVGQKSRYYRESIGKLPSSDPIPFSEYIFSDEDFRDEK